MYELPRTGDPLDDMMLPFVIIYSADFVGLTPVPALPGPSLSKSDFMFYTRLSVLQQEPVEDITDTSDDILIPSFSQLVESELHVLLQHAEPQSLVWGQHMAQLSELCHSRN